ncbi:MAG: carbohydrate ABC transporter permease [Clostridiales bacterium]|jgi:ABC-type glycerol-3-phosphate transport system permease component|nr:carbohydrate ABC transporter permease [Bacillota bacterium]NLK03112.1 carbohydrate ABC transporter permease [Clostridiales bacterium]
MSKEKKIIANKRKPMKHSISDRVLDLINYTVFSLFAFVCVYPFYYIFINTISNNKLSESGAVIWYPKDMHLKNYIDAVKIPGLGQAAFISVSRTVIGTALTVFVAAFLGYMFTRETLFKRKLWYRFVVITMYFNAGIIPWYLTMMNLGLTNNFWGYILPAVVSPFYIILTKTFIEAIPRELQEAAEVDGAGVLTIFYKIMLPICKPILATVAIFSAVGHWNSFQDTLLLMTQEKYYTLQFILYRYLQSSQSLSSIINATAGTEVAANIQTQTSIRMTVTIIVALPIILVYPFFQRFFVKGIMIGAVKG